MQSEKGQEKLRQGREMLKFARGVAAWQLKRGRHFLLEHPSGASSWQEGTIQELEQYLGVYKTNIHQCRYGLRTPDKTEQLRKATTFLTNLPQAAAELARMCTTECRQTPHRPILGTARDQQGRVARLSWHAQHYPQGLADAMLRIIQKQTRNEFEAAASRRPTARQPVLRRTTHRRTTRTRR